MSYEVGDVVRLFYPYVPKVEQQKILKQVAEYENSEQPVFFKGKNRYGIVVGIPDRYTSSLSVVQVMTHGDVTEGVEYVLRDDEIRVPKKINVAHSGGERELIGVVKMERIEQFSKDEVSSPLNVLPTLKQIEMLNRYEYILNNPYFNQKLDRESPNHIQVMRNFKEYMIASRLDFLTNDYGENDYQKKKSDLFYCNRIKKVGKHKRFNKYAVELKNEKGSYVHIISTLKDEQKVGQDWMGEKPAVYWLKQDSKYHVLERDLKTVIQPDRNYHKEDLQVFSAFQNKILLKRNREKRFACAER